MVLFESLALLGGLKDIFLYNRDLYMFNRGINQERIYHTEKMRIEQILLYREDIRDLFNLTIGKMENYLVVNTLMLAFSMGFFYEGRMPGSTPTWLFWLWGMSLATAVLFLIMSVWFAIYALITAQTFSVRLLTQWLRLPVPTQDAIMHAMGTAEDFEKMPKSSLMRVPILSDSGRAKSSNVGGSSSSNTVNLPKSGSDPNLLGATTPGVAHEDEMYPRMANPALEFLFAKEYRHFVDHFYLFRYLQENWAGYDAYARVCMVVGTTQLLSTIGYMGVAWYVSAENRWGGIVFTVLMVVFAVIHARMNVLLSQKELFGLGLLQVGGQLIGCVGAVLSDWEGVYQTIVHWMTPASYMCHLGTIAFFLAMGSEKNGNLPTKFSTVISIDVLGLWEKAKVFHDQDRGDGASGDEEGGYVKATKEAFTGWQKRWLQATKKEMPITQLIPASLDALQADKERKLRPEKLEELVYRKKIKSGSAHNVSPRGLTPGLAGLPDKDSDESNESSEDDANPTDSITQQELMPTKHNTSLPWTSFRQAGALVVLVWLGAIIGSIVEAVTYSVPGWTH